MNRTKVIDLISYSEQLTAQQRTLEPAQDELVTAIQTLIQRLRDCNPITAPTGKPAKNSF